MEPRWDVEYAGANPRAIPSAKEMTFNDLRMCAMNLGRLLVSKLNQGVL